MNTIRFSHEYPKLYGQTSAELLAVRPIRIDRNTPDALLEYDTTYFDKPYKDATCIFSDEKRFPLPTGDYIQLIFLGNLRIPFCTIRSAYPPSKVAYYQRSVGKVFTIEVREVVRDYSTCKHYRGECQQILPLDGIGAVAVQCDICNDATPENCAKRCVFYQRRAAQ